MVLFTDSTRVKLLRICGFASILAIPAAMFAGCGGPVTHPAPRGQQIVAACPPPADPAYYFQPTSINPAGQDEFIRRSFSSYLVSAELLPLWCDASEDEVYRLLYLPSGRPALIVEMRQASGDWLNRRRWNVNVFRFEDPRQRSLRSSEAIKITQRQNHTLADSAAGDFFAALDRAAFWDASPWKDAGVDDGTMILIEARAGGIYRPVTRWSTDARVFSAAVSLIQAANVPVPQELEDNTVRLSRNEGTDR
jgi:hypothetical protein